MYKFFKMVPIHRSASLRSAFRTVGFLFLALLLSATVYQIPLRADTPTANDDTANTNEDSILEVAAPGVLGNDLDADGDPLTVTGYDAGSAQGAVVLVSPDGSYSYDPTGATLLQALSAGWITVDTFTYTIDDGNGGTDTATVRVTVTGINDAPIARDDQGTAFATDEETAFTTANVLFNDTDPDTLDILSVTSINTTGTVGQVTTNGDGTFDYDPDGQFEHLGIGQVAVDTFTYTVSDGNGGSDTATVTITVGGVNDDPAAEDDTSSTDEDTALDIGAPGVLDNDNDPDGDSLQVSSHDAASAQGATVQVNANGSYSYDPTSAAALQALAAGDSVVDTFTYTISDGEGGSDTATVRITVTGINDAPSAVDDTNETDEDTAIDVGAPGVLDNDGDAEDDTLQVTGHDAASAQGATVDVAADGSYRYDPTSAAALQALAVGETIVDTFEYTVSDGEGGSDTATVRITVEGINDAPTAADDTEATHEDAVLNVGAPGVLDNDDDLDGDSLRVTSHDPVSNQGATVEVRSNGSYTYDPTNAAPLQALSTGESVVDTFVYTLDDGNGGSDMATVRITVEGINDAPTAVDDTDDTDEDTQLNVGAPGVLDNDTDPESHPLQVTSSDDTSARGATVVVNPNGSYSYDPRGAAALQALAAGETIVDTFIYTVGDGNGGSDTATMRITVVGVNDAPAATDDTKDTNEDTTLNVGAPGVLANDGDPDTSDILEVIDFDNASALGATVVVNDDGSYTYDPTGAAALQALSTGETVVDTFDYTIGDGHDGNDTATVRITVEGVNDAPTAEDDAGITDEDTALIVGKPGVLGNDTDPEGDTLEVIGYDVTSAQGARLVFGTNGGYVYYPTDADALQALSVGASVVDTFVYTVGDDKGLTDTATVRITVQGVNDAPTAYDDQGEGYATDEDTLLTTANVLANDADLDKSDHLTIISVDTTRLLGQLSDNGNGTFDYDPNGQFEALGVGDQVVESFDYTVSDGNGGADTATVFITINGVNDSPVATDNGFRVQEDTANNLFYPLADDTDIEGDSLTIIGVSQPVSGTVTRVADNSALAYTPDPDFYGYDSFTYAIGDGNGGTDTATINVEVENVNDDPVAQNDSFEIAEDSGANDILVLANDTYLPDPFEELTLASASPPVHGTIALSSDGRSLSYAPDADYYGADSFDYTVIDGNGGSATAEVTITVLNVNDDPQAIQDRARIDEDTKNNEIDVLENDTYLPDPFETLTIVDATDGAHGTVRVEGNSRLTYTPDTDYYGGDQVTYTIEDGNGGTAVGTVVVTVANVNDPPLARPDAIEVDEDSGTNQITVLSNDTYQPDPFETLTVVGVTRGRYGAVNIVDEGARLTYRPEANYYGTDSFAYTISDGNGGYDTTSVDVTVRGINDRPILENDTAATDEDTPVTIDVLENDTDIDGKIVPSTVRVTSGPSHGAATVDDSSGEVTYAPDADWNGNDVFTYRACDDGMPLPSRCNMATVAISVGSINDPPDSDAGSDQEVNTNMSVTLDGTGSTDPDGNVPLIYSWQQVAGPTVALSSNSAPKPTFTAPDDPAVLRFELRVIDSLGQADLLPDQVVITVLNQPPIADAGPDKRAKFGATVSLDASGSRDPDHDTPLTYYWSQTGGPTVKLSSATAQKPTFIAPNELAVLTFTLSVSDTFDEPDPTPDEIVIDVRTFFAYMPIVTNQYVAAPDLVVQSITARSNSVQLVIANQGNAPVQNEFWVDVYLNPQTAPTRVNQTWFDLGDKGLVWGVTGSALSQLVPGGTLTLVASTSDAYYMPDLSAVSWPLSVGTTVYAQVDSYNPSSSYGTVYETHELLGGAYNNIRGPISSLASTTAIEAPLVADREPASLGNLPPRP